MTTTEAAAVTLLDVPFSTQVSRSADGRVEIVVRGPVDALTGDEFGATVTEAWRSAPRQLVVDLRRVSFFSLSSVAVLVAAGRRAEADGASFDLVTGSALTRRLFEFARTLR